MQRDAKALPHRPGPRRGRPGSVLGAVLLDEVEDLVRALVGALRPARAGQQSRQPGRGERRLRGVEGLAAHAKRGRDLGDGPLVDTMSTEHLVLHLHAIAAVEEVVAAEGLVLHGVGAQMERAGGTERSDLGILWGSLASPGHRVNYNTSYHACVVKGILVEVAMNTRQSAPHNHAGHSIPE
jgi:hypothetical protein